MKRELISDLQKALDEELNKPETERDINKITEITDMLFSLTSQGNEQVSESMSASKKQLFKTIGIKQPSDRKRSIKRTVSVATACFAVILTANIVTLNVFGQNVFSSVYHLSKGSISIDVDQNVTGTETSESDPYGIKAKCAEYGFFPEAPDYIPEGFSFDNVIINDEHDEFKSVVFIYKRGKKQLNFHYEYCISDVWLNRQIGIPTDTYNVTEEEINGHTIYVLREDHQYSAYFIDKRIRYGMYGRDLDYEECEKVLRSYT